MQVDALADTGALLALLDRDDRWHEPCSEAFDHLRLPMVTSAAVLTELFHLVGDYPKEMAIAWKLVRSGALTIRPIADDALARLDELMHRYRDRPMDFADATLVYLAERERITTIFTIDRADFSTYRISGRKAFRILPEPA